MQAVKLLSVTLFALLWVTSAQTVSTDALLYGTYQGIYETPVQLQAGFYAGPLDPPDFPVRPTVVLEENSIVRGDLDGDGEDEAAVLLTENSGGTGDFVYLAVVDTQDGEAVNVATTLLGDRIPVQNLSIEGGQIVLDIVIEGPGDAACCKFTKARQVLALQGNTLETVSQEEQGRLSLADLEGVTWLLRGIGTGQSPIEGVQITLTFEAGRVFGSAGCNDFQATYTPNDETEIPVDLVMSPVLTTRKICPPLVMAQEDEFLAKLQGLTTFGFMSGDLQFSYSVDGQHGTMLFEHNLAPSSLTDTPWQWVGYEDPVDGRTDISDPTSFNLTFGIDGRLSLTTDCLTADLPYTAEGSSLMINTSGHNHNLANCDADSPSRRLVRDLEYVRSFSINENRLLFDLFADGGTLVFGKASLISSPSTTAEGVPAPPEDVEARLDAMLNSYLGENTPSAALLVTTPEWTYEKAVGVTELGGDVAVEPDMPFQIGSNTKMMTSTIVLQLHEEGLLDVNDPISRYLPDVASRLPNGEQITILQMLKHRSGLWDYVDPLFYGILGAGGDFSKSWTFDELIDYTVENGTPDFAPDSLDEAGQPNFRYSNTGYLLLGMIIEQVTGKTLSEVYSERIFDPLGMENTFYATGVVPRGTTPRGYFFDGSTARDTTDFNLSAAGPAGAVISTLEDMAVFVSALLNGELYKELATLDLMLSDPKLASLAGGDYALGIQDKSGPGASGLWGHGGQTLAFESDAAYDGDSDTAIVAWTANAETAVPTAAVDVLRIVRGLPSAFLDTPFYLYVIVREDADTELSAEESTRYSVTFGEGGTMSVTADCNQAAATYTLGIENSFTTEFDALPSSDCGSDSLAGDFLTTLETAQILLPLPTETGDEYTLIVRSSDNSMLLSSANKE